MELHATIKQPTWESSDVCPADHCIHISIGNVSFPLVTRNIQIIWYSVLQRDIPTYSRTTYSRSKVILDMVCHCTLYIIEMVPKKYKYAIDWGQVKCPLYVKRILNFGLTGY